MHVLTRDHARQIKTRLAESRATARENAVRSKLAGLGIELVRRNHAWHLYGADVDALIATLREVEREVSHVR